MPTRSFTMKQAAFSSTAVHGGGKRRSFRRHQFGAAVDRDDRHKLPQRKFQDGTARKIVSAKAP
jgi:hypothetical protein